jgi:anti-sigma B factor antagonist
MSAAVVVKLPETLDAKQGRRLERELRTRLGVGSPQLILDLSRVKNIDLSGLQGLLTCLEEVAKQDGGLQLCGVSPEVATLLELTRIDRLMQKFAGFTIDAPQFEMATEPVAEEVPAKSPAQVPVAA